MTNNCRFLQHNLAKIALASVLFGLVPIKAQAGLVPLILSTSTALTPDLGQGYDFVLNNLTLTVTDGYTIGQSFLPLLGLAASIDVA